VDREFTVGGEGKAEVTVNDGGLLVNGGRAVIGDRTPVNQVERAIVTIDGAGSRWQGSDLMIVGTHGRGDLRVFNQAEVSGFRAASVAAEEGSLGFVHVNGSATWELTDYLNAGTRGHGVVFVTNGSLLSAPGIQLGSEETGYGYAYVGGQGLPGNARVETQDLAVGHRGRGELRLVGGVFEGDTAILGLGAAADGTVVVEETNASWTSRTLDVGSWGQGSFQVKSRGTATVEDFVRVGGHVGSSGDVNVAGADARMDVDGEVAVGSSGTGRFEVSGGGAVHSGRGGMPGNNVFAGYNATGVGTAVVRGAGSSWTQDGDTFTLGYLGEGHLEVAEGGRLVSERGALGVGAGAVGTAQVTGTDSQWKIRQRLVVGDSGEGVFNVADGGAVHNDGTAFVGYGSGGEGTFAVAGTGSQWTSGGAVYIGERGHGELTVEQGAVATGSNGATIGHQTGATGHVRVADATSRWTVAGNIRVGDGGQGTLALASGGVVEADQVRVGDGSSLVGTGTVDADVVAAAGAVVAPGFSPGVLTIGGDFALDSMGILKMEIGGTGVGEYDRLIVNGDIFLDGGLEIAFIEGFLPTAEMPVLDLITTSALSGGGDPFGDHFQAWVTGLDPGWEYELIVGAAGIALRSNSAGVPVPEPGSGLLLATGLLGGAVLGRRRGRRAAREMPARHS
jgi:T5SS/PEP-CTERM-associated repeat protein